MILNQFLYPIEILISAKKFLISCHEPNNNLVNDMIIYQALYQANILFMQTYGFQGIPVIWELDNITYVKPFEVSHLSDEESRELCSFEMNSTNYENWLSPGLKGILKRISLLTTDKEIEEYWNNDKPYNQCKKRLDGKYHELYSDSFKYRFIFQDDIRKDLSIDVVLYMYDYIESIYPNRFGRTERFNKLFDGISNNLFL